MIYYSARLTSLVKQTLPAFPHNRSAVGIACLALLLTLGACSKKESAAAAGPGAGAPMEVSVQTLHQQTINIVDELSGRLSAIQVSDVRPQVDGIVQKRLFVEGDTVHAGQALYQLDPATYQATYDTARGTLAKAQAVYAAAEITAKRYQALLAIKGVSAQDVENYVAAAAEDKADVLADQASLESARINLQRTRIVAPISGKIGKSSVTAGALVTSAQTTALSTIQSLDQMYLDVTRTSAEGLRLRKAIASGKLKPDSAPVSLVLEDGSTYSEPGKLLFSDVTVDATTGSVTLRSVFPNASGELLPGMFVRAKLSEGTNDAAILVPQNLVTRASDGSSSVLIVNAQNKVESRAVTADTAYGDQWIVSNGLQAGDRIIVTGLQSIVAGATVKPVEKTDAAAQPASGTAAASATANTAGN